MSLTVWYTCFIAGVRDGLGGAVWSNYRVFSMGVDGAAWLVYKCTVYTPRTQLVLPRHTL